MTQAYFEGDNGEAIHFPPRLCVEEFSVAPRSRSALGPATNIVGDGNHPAVVGRTFDHVMADNTRGRHPSELCRFQRD